MCRLMGLPIAYISCSDAYEVPRTLEPPHVRQSYIMPIIRLPLLLQGVILVV
jgi:hypothetical protein